MREILFKAKRIDNGEWVEGYYLYFSNNHFIFIEDEFDYTDDIGTLDGYAIKIDHNTLSQCTNLKDKNDKMIFENDIIKYKSYNAWNKKGYEHIECVKMEDYGFCPFIYHFDCDDDYYSFRIDFKNVEIMGNRFDNKELLGE